MRYKTSWIWGDKQRVAKAAGILPSYLSNIMAGRKWCRPDLAVRLEAACEAFGYKITRYEWAFPVNREGNPLFESNANEPA